MIDKRRTHDSHQLSGIDNTADIVENGLVLVSLTVLDCDRDTSPEKAADVVVGELGIIAHHLLDVGHGRGP